MSGQPLAGGASGGAGGASSSSSSSSISSRIGMGSPQPHGAFALPQRFDRASHRSRRYSSGRSGSSLSSSGGSSSSSRSVWRWFGCSPKQQQHARRQQHSANWNPDARPACSSVERDAAASVCTSLATEFLEQQEQQLGRAVAPNDHGGGGGPWEERAGGASLLSTWADGGEQQQQQQGERLSVAAARQRRRELELSWLEYPGRDMPFEFADLHEVGAEDVPRRRNIPAVLLFALSVGKIAIGCHNYGNVVQACSAVRAC